MYTLKPSFHFSGSSDPTAKYSLSISNRNTGAIVENITDLVRPSYTLDRAIDPGNYNYKHSTDFLGQNKKWSAPIAFSVAFPEIRPLEPIAEITTSMPTFSWKVHNLSDFKDLKYEFQLVDAESKSLVLRQFADKKELVLKNRLEYNHNYTWSIRIHQYGKVGPWSAKADFKVADRYPIFVSPKTKTYRRSPIFSWTPIESDGDKIEYEFWVNYKKPDIKIHSVVTKDALYVHNKAFDLGKTLLIWVRPIINGKPMNWRAKTEVLVSKEGE
jgi:hypothetical protein